jgi:hypothetical protein
VGRDENNTPNHISVLVEDSDATIILAGDTSYNEGLMLAGKVDGVGSNTQVSAATQLQRSNVLRRRSRPSIYQLMIQKVQRVLLHCVQCQPQPRTRERRKGSMQDVQNSRTDQQTR